MAWVSEFLRRLRIRFRGEQFDQDLAEEMRLHLDLRAADRVAAGMPEEAAAAAARRQFGNTTSFRKRAGRHGAGRSRYPAAGLAVCDAGIGP